MRKLLAAALLLVLRGVAQMSQPVTPEQRLVDALHRVSSGDLGSGSVDLSSYLEVIAEAHAVEAIPDIEHLYAKRTDLEDQLEIAAALVRLGDHNPIYWDLIFAKATEAVDALPPFPYNLKSTPDNPLNPDFFAWIKAKGLTQQEGYNLATLVIPGHFAKLAQTGDPRALSLLRRGLHSGNVVFVDIAAAGLGKLNDTDTIQFILDSCAQPQPVPGFCMLASNLVLFDDPRAEQGYIQWRQQTGTTYAEARKSLSSNNPYAPDPKTPLPRPLPDPAPQKP